MELPGSIGLVHNSFSVRLLATSRTAFCNSSNSAINAVLTKPVASADITIPPSWHNPLFRHEQSGYNPKHARFLSSPPNYVPLQSSHGHRADGTWNVPATCLPSGMLTMRMAGLALVTLLLATTEISAQTGAWLDKMFKGNTSHDFGNAPHGAQLYYRFPMTNIWAVPLDVGIERVSCGCVTASLSTNRLQPRESGYLEVNMNARLFTGPRTVTIYITVGPQYTSTTAIRVSAHSRTDVVFNPGQVKFGVVQR